MRPPSVAIAASYEQTVPQEYAFDLTLINLGGAFGGVDDALTFDFGIVKLSSRPPCQGLPLAAGGTAMVTINIASHTGRTYSASCPDGTTESGPLLTRDDAPRSFTAPILVKLTRMASPGAEAYEANASASRKQ
jgi:hypothetical protein